MAAEIFGLSDKTRATLVAMFSAYPEILRVIVYGSRAKGNYREGSDIDIALDAPDLTFAQVLAIRGAIDDSNIPYLVDLSRLQDLKEPDLLEHIGRVGKVLPERGGAWCWHRRSGPTPPTAAARAGPCRCGPTQKGKQRHHWLFAR